VIEQGYLNNIWKCSHAFTKILKAGPLLSQRPATRALPFARVRISAEAQPVAAPMDCQVVVEARSLLDAGDHTDGSGRVDSDNRLTTVCGINFGALPELAENRAALGWQFACGRIA
jgi:hypothetical protein